MRQFLLIFLSILFTNFAFAQGLTKNGKITITGAEYVNKNGGIGGEYGVDKNGKVVTEISLPTVNTITISAITSTTAISGVNVTSDGGGTVIVKGICWSTTSSPTTELSTKTIDGTGSITGLTLGTTYYVRAYATNALGTAYGNELSFTAVLAVGEAYQGGIIAVITENEGGIAHGLIVSLNVLSASVNGESAIWQYPVVSLATTDNNGQANTMLIVADQAIQDPKGDTNTAGEVCANYSVVGSDGVTYDDWYLPSKDELFAIRGQLSRTYSMYWSSTQVAGTENAWYMKPDGSFVSYWKRNGCYVRAVRSF